MPKFKLRIRKTFKDCLTRQTSEAVAIMMHKGPLLNGKNDYFTNCISRVKVDENEFERKKREAQDDTDEKERLRRLEIFRGEKVIYMKGYKRSRVLSILPVGEKVSKKPRLDLKDDPTTCTPSFKNIIIERNQQLAIEYFPVQSCGESKDTIPRAELKTAPTVDCDADPPNMGGRNNPQNKTCKGRKKR